MRRAPLARPRLDLAPTRTRSEDAWRRGAVLLLVATDAGAIVAALGLGYLGRFGANTVQIRGINYLALAAVLLMAWLGALAASRAYEPRLLGVGTEEYRRVLTATLALFGGIAVVSYLGKLEIARGFVGLVLPVGLLLLLLARSLVRAWLRRHRQGGRWCHRVVVAGDEAPIHVLSTQLRRAAGAGFLVVGSCLPARFDDLLVQCRLQGADVVAVASSPSVTADALRRIAWALEGSGIDLVVAPAVTEVAGPRVSVRPVAGVPLLYIDEPRFTGATRVVKRAMDILGALLGLLLAVPLLLVAAVAVRATSPGPASFRQMRIGKDGRQFRVLKLRTMYVDAEARLAALRPTNDSDGLLFKLLDDPRVSPVGRFLRRTSIDELPQLWNVLVGDMSLVGPRPLPVRDSDFVGHVRRRLLVRPGLTGLWQVSGRSTLGWDDAVRLDLYYVENWSLSLDLTILARTVLTVVRGDGAC